MGRGRTVSRNGQLDTLIRLQSLTQPEIHAYISSLKQTYAKYEMPFAAGRKIIDDAMKTASLTQVLYEAREQ